METSLSHEAEEYIENIYKLEKRNGLAKTKELAQNMHVVPGSVTNTIEHLKSHGLVTHKPYYGVKLTRQGEKIALDIIRKHRLAECLLTDVLKAEWSSVHEDACKLEHALTKNVAALLEEKLGHPRFCPHGNPIPTENGKIEELPCIAITEAELNEKYIVCCIVNEANVNFQVLAEKNIKPETKLTVLKRTPNHINLRVDNKECQLDESDAANILLRKATEECSCY
jgi:DtxR family Mn-dependent transcriptional regulator